MWRWNELLFLVYHATLVHSLYNDLRLASLSEPDFKTSFFLRSNNGSDSFKEVQTGKAQMPFYVRVYAKVLNGVNSGLCFEATGAAQVSARKTSYHHAGIVFGYNESVVRIWAPSVFKGTGSNGRVVSVGQGWGGGIFSQSCEKALVVVEIWYIGPFPSFQTNKIVDTLSLNNSFIQIDHKLGQIPERVLVRVTPYPATPASANTGFWFNAITSSQNSEKRSYGGVIFAYDEQKILIWAPSFGTKKTGCIFIENGWGNEQYAENTQKCCVHIFAWVSKFPIPTFRTEWKLMASQGLDDQTFLEIDHNIGVVPSLVIVQGRIDSKGLIFEGTGVVMSTDENTKGYGGILYAYDKNKVRIWLPKRDKGTKNGFSILVKKGWGNDQMLQEMHKVRIRVIIYTSNCNSQREIAMEKGICKSIQYDSYEWTTGPWGKCSSICNKGLNHREILACNVSGQETVLECSFAQSMCNWQSAPEFSWSRQNDSVASSFPNFGWNIPSDFYYVFATSNGSQFPVRLASPVFSPRQSCSLTFSYKMFGSPSATLSVLVSEEYSKPMHSGWSMYDDQGGLFWRRGFVKLSSFSKITQIIFEFTLAQEPEPDFSPSHGNVSIDDIKLVCQTLKRREVDTNICQERKIPSAGCIHPATQPKTKGPAYDLITAIMNKQVYVIAKGERGNLIASYDFMVDVSGEYSIWLSTHGTSKADNSVRFKIDNLDQTLWHTTYIENGRPMWTQYRHETFSLKAGEHTVHLIQFESNFRYSHIMLTPKELLTWVPLGMQSQFIPDSALNAYPPSSLPDPKFGRLNGKDAWCSSDHNAGYVRMQITLPQLALISRIAIQGGHQIKQKTNRYWVTAFGLKVSVDGEHFSWYSIASGKKMFAGNIDSNGVVEHEFPFAVLAKSVLVFPMDWKYWICMRFELYGVYMTESMCAAAGQETVTTKECLGSRDCSLNAECKPLTNDSIIKTGLHDNLKTREACHCHPGYHGDSCEYLGCDPNPCHNGGICKANSRNFTCNCMTGYYGHLCQWSCPVGKYGKDCAHTCLCGRYGSCNIATGHCSCEAGYYGIKCELECPRGYFGVDCKQTCQCWNNGHCNHVTGACNCTAGWTGVFCDQPCLNDTWGIQCEMPCHCSEKTLSCNPVSGECICEPGIMGKTCNDPCPIGKYGSECSGTCQCSKHGVCDQTDGSCACQSHGWTGIYCNQSCPKGFYGKDCKKHCLCAPNAECSSISGVCKCGSGFSGPSCTVPCEVDRWGPDCKFLCLCNASATCDGVSGFCHCLTWGHGTYCNSTCPDGTWGVHCQLSCDCSDHGSCDLQTGVCQCSAGWGGSKCNQTCQTGFYGLACQYKCNCEHGEDCDAVTGRCVCPTGWVGSTCAQACPIGYYGNACADVCSCRNGAVCDHVSGACLCDAGFTGDDCSQRCPDGYFGPGCGTLCQCSHGNGSCDHITGKCPCPPGYIGPRCSQTCEPGLYGQECSKKCRCQNGAECRLVDGQCLCLAGYHGDNCEHKCPHMKYGVNCTQSCDSCIDGQVSSCDHVTGKCLCLPGYYGYHCENKCSQGKYGNGCLLRCDCDNGASCNHVDGKCECSDGFTGTKCELPCPDGKFGTHCLGVCLCDNGGKCDKVNGQCTCLPGYTGMRCMDQCSDRWWGLDCRNQCLCEWNQTMRCTGDTGQCLCHAGYRGVTCGQFCGDGTYGEDCKHSCPSCSRHVTGPCYKIDGRCPCSPGYRGHLCDNDCILKHFGENCGKRCECEPDHVCYHVTGACKLVAPGKFQIMIKENYTDFDDTQRRKQLKLHLAALISEYFERYERLHQISPREAPPTLFNTTLLKQPANSHDFVARILELVPGLTSDGSEDLVLINLIIFDGEVLLNGSLVKDVIESLNEDDVSSILGSVYYSGELYSEHLSTTGYVQLITGIAGGLLVLVLLIITMMMCRRRRRQLKRLKSEKKRQREAETEMELKTRGFRHNGYRLAFDNPYYDVLAAMAIDDDVEEDYINPLCDLDSLMSHRGSDGTVSSATECSTQKGGSLQSVSYC